MKKTKIELLETAKKYSNMPEESLFFMLGVDVFYDRNPDLKKRE